MRLKKASVRLAINKAKEMRDLYRQLALPADDGEIDVEKFRALAEQQIGKPVQMLLFDERVVPRNIKGQCLIYDDKVVVCVHTGDDMNYCWTRFVAFKELFHGLIDDDPFHNVNIYEHVEEAVEGFTVGESQVSDSAQCEAMAEFAAMELLFPYAERVKVLANPPVDLMAVAMQYRIPKMFVERFLTDRRMATLLQFETEEAAARKAG